jgi:hypothetical protein
MCLNTLSRKEQAAISFANLQSARKNKDAKSFVSSGGTAKGQQHADAIAISTHGADSKDTDATTEESAVFNIPPGLPTSVDTRASPIAGRGLFAKNTFLPGIFLLRQPFVGGAGFIFPQQELSYFMRDRG